MITIDSKVELLRATRLPTFFDLRKSLDKIFQIKTIQAGDLL